MTKCRFDDEVRECVCGGPCGSCKTTKPESKPKEVWTDNVLK